MQAKNKHSIYSHPSLMHCRHPKWMKLNLICSPENTSNCHCRLISHLTRIWYFFPCIRIGIGVFVCLSHARIAQDSRDPFLCQLQCRPHTSIIGQEWVVIWRIIQFRCCVIASPLQRSYLLYANAAPYHRSMEGCNRHCWQQGKDYWKFHYGLWNFRFWISRWFEMCDIKWC